MAGYTGIGNVSPVTVSILAQPFQAVALKPGQIFHGIVQSLEPQTLLRFGAMVLPVEHIEGVQPGQAVSAEVIDSGSGPQLRITPQHVANTASHQHEASALSTFVVEALRTLGKLEMAGQAVHLVPRHLSQNATAVRLALTLLLDDSEHSDDARRVLQFVQAAIDEGEAASAEVQRAVNALRFLTGDDAVAALVRNAGEAVARKPLEARLHEAIARGDLKSVVDAAQDDLFPAIQRLKDDSALTSFLRGTGHAGEFLSAIDRLVDRFLAAQLLNARGIEYPYLFFEVPVTPDGPIQRAHIHIMGDGGGHEGQIDAKNASIVFDITTESLGRLWITVGITHGTCSCWMRAQDVATVTLLNQQSSKLVEQLNRAGYAGATVQASLWDGDRVRELSMLMRRFEGIDVKA